MVLIASSTRAPATKQAAQDALLALGATLALLVFHAVRGFPTLADSGGDNDSVLRLVQVRDLLAGQGWFDPFQYRMGLEGGFAMHWSRLVDLPIAMLVSLFGETAALVLWPSLLFCLCLFLILRAARTIGGEDAILPALVTGGLALYFVNVFAPGALDHHNVQLALAIGALASLVGGRAPAVAGICAALMLAIGMEAAPYAAAACTLAALFFLFDQDSGAPLAARFGGGFAATSLAALISTTPASGWLVSQCDAFSFPQAALGVLGGGGLALVATTNAFGGSFSRRLIGLCIIAAPCVALALIAFPHCLADPYADLAPRLRQYWLGSVTEAQSFTSILQSAPDRLAVYYATPFVALGVTIWMIVRQGLSHDRAVVLAFLGAAVLVSLWQVRGSTFAIPLATIPLAAMISVARRQVETSPTPRAQMTMVLAWLVSVNLLWQLAVAPFAKSEEVTGGSAVKSSVCYAHEDYAQLAALSPGTVAVISNLGSSVLRNTPHRVLAGPYHRNQDGNLANLDVWMGTPQEGLARLNALGIGYVALCRGNDETDAVAAWAPEGLLMKLLNGKAPEWLSPVEDTIGQDLEVWRVSERTE